jgi:hypothetical protein
MSLSVADDGVGMRQASTYGRVDGVSEWSRTGQGARRCLHADRAFDFRPILFHRIFCDKVDTESTLGSQRFMHLCVTSDWAGRSPEGCKVRPVRKRVEWASGGTLVWLARNFAGCCSRSRVVWCFVPSRSHATCGRTCESEPAWNRTISAVRAVCSMARNAVLDLPLSQVCASEIALTLKHVLNIYTVGGLLRAWRSPRKPQEHRTGVDTPHRRVTPYAVCARGWDQQSASVEDVSACGADGATQPSVMAELRSERDRFNEWHAGADCLASFDDACSDMATQCRRAGSFPKFRTVRRHASRRRSRRR